MPTHAACIVHGAIRSANYLNHALELLGRTLYSRYGTYTRSYFYGVFRLRAQPTCETRSAYDETGNVIVELWQIQLRFQNTPSNHGPFSWGKNLWLPCITP